jgi:hypothetical protein
MFLGWYISIGLGTETLIPRVILTKRITGANDSKTEDNRMRREVLLSI